MADQPRRRPLTQISQARLAELLQPGDLAVDATVGNGHDTLFLARQVGDSGHVWGFDVQSGALDNARTLLEEHGLLARVTLLHSGHECMTEQLAVPAHGRLAAVMFNLGYLPGSDKTLTTLPDTTLKALDASLENLKTGGLLSIMVYRGHAGGQAEAAAVARWLGKQPKDSLSVETMDSPGPLLYLIEKH